MTGSQYEYCFSEDGFGLYKSVTCICGESIALTDEYNLTDDIHKPFQIAPTDQDTIDLVKMTLRLRNRPGMLIGSASDRSYRVLHAYLAGRSCNNRVYSEMFWKGARRLETQCEGKECSDRERYELFFDCFEDVLKEDYPLFVEESHIFGDNNRSAKDTQTKKEDTDLGAVKEVTLFFENCENVKFHRTEIQSVKISKITEEELGPETRKTAKYIKIVLEKSGADRLINCLGYGPIRVHERLKHSDISEIRFVYDSGITDSIYPYWKGDWCNNDCQLSEDIYDGSLVLYVIKNKKKRKKILKKIMER